MSSDSSLPPGDLDAQARRLYFKLRSFLRAEGRWEDSDRYVLGQVCRYEVRARLARAGLPVDGQGRVVLTAAGAQGQEVAHPNVRTAEAAERLFVDGLRELGLTPRSRAQLGFEPRPGGGGKFGGAFS